MTDIEIGHNFLVWLDPCVTDTESEHQLLDSFGSFAGVAASRRRAHRSIPKGTSDTHRKPMSLYGMYNEDALQILGLGAPYDIF